MRSAIAALAEIVPLSLADRDGTLRLTAEAGPATPLAAAEESGRREIVRRAAASIPDEVSLAYYEPERDFQAGLQRATTGASPGASHADRRALPAALPAENAKALAELRLATLRAGRTSARLRLGWPRSALRPGDAVRLEGESGIWRVQRWTLGPATLTLELRRVTGAALAAPAAAAPGRAVSEADLPHGPTRLRLIDAPLGEPQGARPLLFAAAAGSAPGWRRAGLLASFDGGGSWQSAGAAAAPATMGLTATVLAPGGSTLIDTVAAVEVELLHGGMMLEHASDAALAAGANLALIGAELVQFGRADWLGGGRYRLSRLLRGRRGTEWAAGLHGPGEPFLLVEAETLAPVEAPAGSAGGEARLSASGVGDVEPATAEAQIQGESLRPPSPAHLRAERLGNGDIQIDWVRRSRQGWSWPNGGDTPLAEETERYRLEIGGEGFARTIAADQPSHLYTAAAQAEDGAAGTIQLSVVQVGTHGVSRPAVLTLA